MSSRLQVPKMYKLFIGGKFTRTESERYLPVHSVKGRKLLCNISRGSRKDIRNAVVAARAAYKGWNSKTGYERGQILYRLAEMLEGRKEQFINEIILNSGVSKSNAQKEVNKSIDRIIWYAGASDKWVQFTGSINDVQDGYFNFSIPEATGIVGIVLPDDLSLLPLISRICPVIVSGNTCIVIPSDKFPLPSLTFSEVISTSDIPGGVINIITGLKKELIPHLSSHMDVNAFDYADWNNDVKKEIQIDCANNVKRFTFPSLKVSNDYFKDELNETFYEIEKFSELKTIWHTKGL